MNNDRMPRIGLLINSLPDFFNVKDGQGRWIEANSVALDVFHIPTTADYKGKSDSELAQHAPFFTEALMYCEETDEHVWLDGNTVRGEEFIPQPDGSIRVFDTVKVPIFNDDGSRRILIVIGRDISEHVKARHELEESKQRYKSLFHNNPNAVFSLDLNRRFTSINSKMEEMCGYKAEELIGQPTKILVAEDSQAAGEALFHYALNNLFHSVEISVNTKSGTTLDVEVHEMPIVVNDKVIGVYGVAQDISEKKRAQQINQHLAFYDTLTGLANRALLSQTITTAINDLEDNQSTLAVLFVDLDHFKSVNDTKGHSAGDELLKQVAARLRECVRFNKDMICRLGGDEFIILLQDIDDVTVATKVAERIIDTFSKPFYVAHEAVYITASIGIAISSESQKDAESLIKSADIAMYEAKRKGKNTFRFFDQSLNDQVQHNYEVETSLRKALERGEFTLHYQPQVDAITHEFTGVEALIRWVRSSEGIVYPREFIQIAEQTGLIVPLGHWVLRKACEQIRKWSDEGLKPFRVSINISPRQFQNEGLVGHFREALRDTGVSGEWLGVEITESGIIPDVEYAQKTLMELRDMGITIDIDDFGTGYSSFSYLMDLPVDRIKIDQTFVRNLSKKKAIAIVKSIIALAKNLDILSVAEGVETQSQRDTLASFGCDELQGYLIHKPITADELIQLFNPKMTLADEARKVIS